MVTIKLKDGETHLPYSFRLDKAFGKEGITRYRVNNEQHEIGYWVGPTGGRIKRIAWSSDAVLSEQIVEAIMNAGGQAYSCGDGWLGNTPKWHPDRFITQRITFNEHHFPPGTKFVCEGMTVLHRTEEVFTTEYVSQQPQGWLIHTTTPCDALEGCNVVLHVDHVTRILERGEGKVVYKPNEGMEPYVGPFKNRVALIRHFIRDYGPLLHRLREEELVRHAHPYRQGDRALTARELKKAKRYIKRNINRYLDNDFTLRAKDREIERLLLDEADEHTDGDRRFYVVEGGANEVSD